MKIVKVGILVTILSSLGLYGVMFQSVEVTLPREDKEDVTQIIPHNTKKPIEKSIETSVPELEHTEGSHLAEKKQPNSCTYTTGSWVGNLTWEPVVPKGCSYHQFTREKAFECLSGKQIVLIGNSNMRALYSALEGILKDKVITPRLEAKQSCENNQKNHSCGMTVSFNGYKNVRLWYWGYVKGVFNHRVNGFFKYEKNPDVVFINSGLNVIQKVKSKEWMRSVVSETPQLLNFIRDTFSNDQTNCYYMTTTRICEDQPHFKKYTYRPKYWLHRSLSSMNSEVSEHNKLVLKQLSDHQELTILDAAELASDRALCPFYDDPLHHKAVDKVIANIFLNNYCNG